jgi:flavin-dependent dehydrogenase
MHSCDVLIVGGGPAGSACAWGLRASGLRVLVLDKATFPRHKVCGGWITPWVLKALAVDINDYSSRRTLQPITAFRISSMGEPDSEIRYEHAISYGIRRCEFDEYLLRRSEALLIESTPVKSIERSGDLWIVNGEIRAKLLIGAGGHFCPISKFMGNTNREESVVAQEIEFEMTPHQAGLCGVHPEIPELYFCHDMLGYGWCFRKSNFLNIGLGRLDQHGLSQHVERFVTFLRDTGKAPFELPSHFCGHAYLLFGNSRRKILDDSVMLIGDAAGLAYSQSGEGIRPAIDSGLLAARTIQSSQSRYGRQQLQPYASLLAQRLNDQPSPVQLFANRLPSNLRNALARILLRTEWFCRKVVLENWFLHMNEAAAGRLDIS